MAVADTKQAKMIAFHWEGINRSGESIQGDISASSISEAKIELRQQGVVPKTLKKKSKPLFSMGQKKLKSSDIAVISRQLATMITSGVPLVQGVEIIGKGNANPNAQELLMTIKADLEAGHALNECLAKHPKYFDELYCNLVSAGEQSGTLDSMLQRIATYKERIETIKKKVKKALYYPAAVMAVALIVTVVLLLFVVPQFESLFKGFGADLPMFTRMVIDMSRWMQDFWWVAFFFVAAAAFSFGYLKKNSDKFNFLLDKLVLKLPVVGNIMQKAAIARYSRTLSITFAAGLPLVDALKCVSGTVGNLLYTNAVIRIRDEVAMGHTISFAMHLTKMFPNMVEQMIAIGEESGSLDDMLGKVADFYEEEVNNAVDSLSSLLEPLIMAVLGILIGGLVAAMYLPIFKLGSVV